MAGENARATGRLIIRAINEESIHLWNMEGKNRPGANPIKKGLITNFPLVANFLIGNIFRRTNFY